MNERAHDDELNNQGDYVSGEIGPDGKSNLVGKNLTQKNRHTNQRNDNRVEVNLPDIADRQPRLADVYAVLADDPLRGTPGLVSKVNSIDRRLITVEGKISIMETRLINIEELITVRNNQYSGKVHLTLLQLFFLLILLVLIIAVITPWLQHILSSSVLDSHIGYWLTRINI